jgi:MFS family permease
MKRPTFLTRNILILSIVSLLTDVASEMLYPVIPLYLKEIGYGVIIIGLIEGAAQTIAGMSKGYFGFLSDKLGKRVLFIRLGYGISAISKPIMGLSQSPFFVFSARLADRFGKGIRTAPRDAILAQESTPANRGKVFGFHRSMDTLGATIGPILALVFLYFNPGQYRTLFLIVLIPGLLSTICTFLIDDGKDAPAQSPKRPTQWNEFKNFWEISSASYKQILIGLTITSLLGASDMFLILRAKELGLTDITIIVSYILYNLIFTFAAFPIGILSDKFGFRKTYLSGLVVFALVYGVLSYTVSHNAILVMFALYGIYGAVSETVSKAWLSTSIPPEYQGTGLGLHMTLQAVTFLVASAIMGISWHFFGSQITFAAVSSLALGIIYYFLRLKIKTV